MYKYKCLLLIRNVKKAQDTLTCYEGLLKIFLGPSSFPLANLKSVVARITSMSKCLYPDITQGA
jgi:hypothetical protein